MKLRILLLVLTSIISCKNTTKTTTNFTTLFEVSKGTETSTYPEVINYYKELTATYPEISMHTIGQTDSGYPLHLIIFNTDGKTNLQQLKTSSKTKILINNGIHPGESDGIDATMLLLRDIVSSDTLQKTYKNSIICIIPVYNIGGALNRNSHTRVNQNGPKTYGFRGNARNYDLNRDFIKQDTKNAAAFARIFHMVLPDVFVDNHVSNGADYQYAITHLLTQHNKLGGDLGAFLETKMRPYLEHALTKKGIQITPYVNVWGTTPDKGWEQFLDSPRYSTGYTTLFNTLGLMVETHMLKPYKIRVEQTYELLFSVLDFTETHAEQIKTLRQHALEKLLNAKTYPILFKADYEQPSQFDFKGYEGTSIESKVTTGKRLFYDQTKPYSKTINYYNHFKATDSVTIPKAYILPQGWHRVIERLHNNNIQYSTLKNDSTIRVEVSYIDHFETQKTPYEGHYLHYNTTTQKALEPLSFKQGDIIISTQQYGIRYLLETLEAEAPDSFFNWNFFDTVLQQKEHFSPYVFEDNAESFLQQHPTIKTEFDRKIATDSLFSKSPYKQLNWIYKQTPHYEKVHNRLPIFRVL